MVAQKRNSKTNLIGFALHKDKIPKIIINQAKKNKSIIYGAQAMNKQLPGMFKRETVDWDVYSINPRKSANQLQHDLDKEVAGQDDFFMKRALHKGTWKVMHEGSDGIQGNEDDYQIADYTKMPRRKPKTYGRRGKEKYERISEIVAGKKKILRDTKSKYRHSKDRSDLNRITAYRKIRRVRI